MLYLLQKIKVFLQRQTGRFITEGLMGDNPGINKNNISNKRVYIRSFSLHSFWSRLFVGSSLLDQGSKGHWKKYLIFLLPVSVLVGIEKIEYVVLPSIKPSVKNIVPILPVSLKFNYFDFYFPSIQDIWFLFHLFRMTLKNKPTQFGSNTWVMDLIWLILLPFSNFG